MASGALLTGARKEEETWQRAAGLSGTSAFQARGFQNRAKQCVLSPDLTAVESALSFAEKNGMK